MYPNPTLHKATCSGTQLGTTVTVLDAVGHHCSGPRPMPTGPQRWCVAAGVFLVSSRIHVTLLVVEYLSNTPLAKASTLVYVESCAKIGNERLKGPHQWPWLKIWGKLNEPSLASYQPLPPSRSLLRGGGARKVHLASLRQPMYIG